LPKNHARLLPPAVVRRADGPILEIRLAPDGAAAGSSASPPTMRANRAIVPAARRHPAALARFDRRVVVLPATPPRAPWPSTLPHAKGDQMKPILTPEVLFTQAGLAPDASASALQAELARRGWEARVEGPGATTGPAGVADRYRAVAVLASGVGRLTDPLRHPTHLERTAASPEVALGGVLATVLALEAGAVASREPDGAEALG
jgi:hypothetical protein